MTKASGSDRRVHTLAERALRKLRWDTPGGTVLKAKLGDHQPQMFLSFLMLDGPVSFSKPAFLARGQGLSQGMGTQ